MTVDERCFTSPAGAISSPELSAVTRTGSGSEPSRRMTTITSDNGRQVFIDDEDLPLIAQYRWKVYQDSRDERKLHHQYATTYVRNSDGTFTGLLMHRLIMHAGPQQMIDHKDGNGLNNQKSNIRFCTHSQNMRNMRNRIHTKSGFKGVAYQPKGRRPWIARIWYRKKKMYLGAYSTPQEAARKYNEYALKYFGEYAHLNRV